MVKTQRRAVMLVGFLSIGLVTAAQDRMPDLPAKPLHPTTSSQLPVPGFRSWDAPQCDARGNLYFRIGQQLNETSILRMTSDGTNHDLYTLPSDFADVTAYTSFNVDPDGVLHLLVEHKEGGYYLFTFKRDSTSSSHIRLDVPAHIRATTLAVLPTGNVLFSGFYADDADEAQKGKPYHALFAPSGKLHAMLKHNFEMVDRSKGNFGMDATPKLDERGKLYFVDGSRILVVSQTGEIEHTIAIQKPSPEFRIGRVQIAAGRIAVWFMRTQPRHPVELKIGILDVFSGQPLALYEPDSDLGNNAVCFDGTELTFFRIKNSFVQLLSASTR